MTVDDQSFKDTYRDWLIRALARDAEQWAELERELARLREKVRTTPGSSERQ
jgi:hypothetical protein